MIRPLPIKNERKHQNTTRIRDRSWCNLLRRHQ